MLGLSPLEKALINSQGTPFEMGRETQRRDRVAHPARFSKSNSL
jgi:hypothetical protein